MSENGEAALQVPEQGAVHARQVADAARESREFGLDGGGSAAIAGNAGEMDLFFEAAPLAAEFGLACRAAGNALGVVVCQGGGSGFEAKGEFAKNLQPRREEFAGGSREGVDVRPDRQADARWAPQLLLPGPGAAESARAGGVAEAHGHRRVCR